MPSDADSQPVADARRAADAHRSATMRHYEEMSKVRNRLVIPLALTISVFFFALLVLGNYTSLLDGIAFSGISWAYVWAFATFFLVVILTTVYKRQMDAAEARLARDFEEDVK